MNNTFSFILKVNTVKIYSIKVYAIHIFHFLVGQEGNIRTHLKHTHPCPTFSPAKEKYVSNAEVFFPPLKKAKNT